MALSARTQYYLKVAMADEVAANEVISDLSKALAMFASFTGTPAGLTTPITLTAANAGVAGNSISLTGDGTSTVNQLISAWNLAHPSNQVNLTSGVGTQVPNNAVVIALAGGAASARVALSARTQYYLKVAMADVTAAQEVINAVQTSGSTAPAVSARTQDYIKVFLADQTAGSELISVL